MSTPPNTVETAAPTSQDTVRPSKARVVALMNQKGGVGKTTTTVNLAAAAARLGVRTLIVDLDSQAHASLHLGADEGALEEANEGTDADESQNQQPSVYELLLAPPGIETGDPQHQAIDPRDAIIRAPKGSEGRPDVLPAVTDLAAVETELADQPVRHHRLKAGLKPILGDYDLIVLDCPPSLGLLTLNGLAAAAEVIIPMQAHFLALQGVGKLLETVSLVSAQVNPSLKVAGVVLCMHDEQARHTREVVGDIEAFFDAQRDADVPWQNARVYRPAIRRNIKLAEAPSFGQSVFEYDPTCAGAKDYTALAKNIFTSSDTAPKASAQDSAQAEQHPSVDVQAEMKPQSTPAEQPQAPSQTGPGA